jgi:hypothetical protein
MRELSPILDIDWYAIVDAAWYLVLWILRVDMSVLLRRGGATL